MPLQVCHSSLIAHYFFGRIAAERRPGFAGLRYRSGPACGVAAPHPSNPLRGGQPGKKGRSQGRPLSFPAIPHSSSLIAHY
jgi:hypothetical protein